VQAILANRIAPGLLDRYLARSGYSGQLTQEPKSDDAPSNLFETVKGNYGSHGRFDSRSKPRSIQMFTDRHRTAFWGVAGLLALFGLHRLARRFDV